MRWCWQGATHIGRIVSPDTVHRPRQKRDIRRHPLRLAGIGWLRESGLPEFGQASAQVGGAVDRVGFVAEVVEEGSRLRLRSTACDAICTLRGVRS